MKKIFSISLLIILVLFISNLFGETANLSGTVHIWGGYGNVEDVLITYIHDETGETYTTYPNSDGDYSFTVLPVGWCTLTAELDICETYEESLDLLEGDNWNSIWLDLLPAIISGHIELYGGNGNVQDVTLIFQSYKGDSTGFSREIDENGDYIIELIPYDRYHCEAILYGYIIDEYYIDWELEPGEEVTVNFDLYAVSIQGMVVLDGGNGYVGAVQVTTGCVTINPDQYGYYILENDPSTYTVTASLTNYDPQSIIDVILEPYQHTTGIDFTLQYNPTGIIEGTVILSGGGNGQITDVAIKAGGITVNPDASGYYSIEIPVGTYDVRASLPAYSFCVENDIVVEDGVTITVDLNLSYTGMIFVSQDEDLHFTTIRGGINAAQDGETVVVMNGTYTGTHNTNLTWHDKHITVRAQSLNHPENCIIDCFSNNNRRGFYLTDSQINNSDHIYGFTIKNASLDRAYGAGINCWNGASPIIQNCIIEHCCIDNEGGSSYTKYGVGIYCEGTTVIKNCIIKYNIGRNIQGGVGIACKGNVLIDGCTIRNNLNEMYNEPNYPPANFAGAGIYVLPSSNGNPTIRNNYIYNNACNGCVIGPGDAIFIEQGDETDIPIIIEGNSIHDNPPDNYGSYGAIFIVDCGKPIEICNNLIFNNLTDASSAVKIIYDSQNGSPVGPYYLTFENNTIVDNQGDGLFITNGDETILKNNVIAGNTGYGIKWVNGAAGLTVEYCIINGNSSGNYLNDPTVGVNVFHINPLLDDENGYKPIWDNQYFSPCIDTGDPDEQYNDPDESRSDMGAIPAIWHKYDNWQLPPNSVDDGWKWMSFPSLDDLTNADDFDGDMAQYMLADILNPEILDSVIWKPILIQYSGLEKIKYIYPSWTNSDHIFTSPQGYKFNMDDALQNYEYLEISGFLEASNTVIHLWGNLEDNWIGYFLDETQSIEDAFGSAMYNIYSIQMQHWENKREEQSPDAPWIIPESKVKQTVTYGDMLIVQCFDDMDFIWSSNGSVPPHERKTTSYFTFSEQADYVPIFVEFDPENIPDEIGVLVDGEFKGASVVEDTLGQICAYIIGCNGVLEFELYYDNKSCPNQQNDYFVYNPETKLKEKRTIKVDENKEYYSVSFKSDEIEIIPEHFNIQNFPNPFTHSTTIQYALPKETDVTITVYNLKGQKIKTLVNIKHTPGIYTAIWDGKNEAGNSISNGIYFYKLSTRNKTLIRKMLLMR